jgi:hypothetical protein
MEVSELVVSEESSPYGSLDAMSEKLRNFVSLVTSKLVENRSEVRE